MARGPTDEHHDWIYQALGLDVRRAMTAPIDGPAPSGDASDTTDAVRNVNATAPNGVPEGQPSMDAEEQHGRFWWWLHSLGLMETKHERGDTLRRGWGSASGVIVFDDDGEPINVEQLSDDEVIALDKKYRNERVGSATAAAVAPIMTQWGWSGSKTYKRAVSQLRQPGTHADLDGKVPSRTEATRMIEESGGKVVRQDPAHPEGGISTHHDPHINYTTASGQKATIIVRE